MTNAGWPDGSWADVAETHTGAVFFAGDTALKVRKPVRFGFVDLSTAQLRREAVTQEVALNRRLAPDVYRGVGEVVLPDGTREPALVMRRLPAAARLSALVRARAPGLEAAIATIARTMAAFHADCPVREDVGDVAHLRELWDDVRATLSAHPQLAAADVVDAMHATACDYLAGRAELFDQRQRTGCVRDGHGDLLADDVFVLADGPRILDCLDFDPRLRCGDVALDIAFLAMDLERLGAPDLAQLLLSAYRDAGGRDTPASLEHFFIAYRAAVRAKVTALRFDQGAVDVRPAMRDLLELAVRHLAAAQAQVVLVGGLPGSGKSTRARALADRPGWTMLSTDELRPGRRGDPGRYSTAARDGVYDEMLTRAEHALALGASVVLDATWEREQWRERARALARRRHARITEICCVVDDETAAARLAVRAGDASEADEAVRRRLAATFDPWPQAQPGTFDPVPTVIGPSIVNRP